MEWVETTGKTLQDAKDAALDQLGVDEADAEFVVLGEPRSGLFGRLRGEARVRARVRPATPAPKRPRGRGATERRRNGSSGPSARTRTTSGTKSGSGRSPGDKSKTGSKPRSKTVSAKATKPQETDAATQATPERSGTVTATTRSQAQTAKGDGTAKSSGRRQGAKSSRASDERARHAGPEPKEETLEEGLSIEEQAETARLFVDGLVKEIGLAATVESRVVDESTAEVDIQGAGLGVLIGRGGTTLAALQELARTVVQRSAGGHSDRILVDVAGYKVKRAEALRRFAAQIAQEVRESGTERALEPMIASDRKVVHDAVNEVEGVSTRSEGVEPRRYIVVAPLS